MDQVMGGKLNHREPALAPRLRVAALGVSDIPSRVAGRLCLPHTSHTDDRSNAPIPLSSRPTSSIMHRASLYPHWPHCPRDLLGVHRSPERTLPTPLRSARPPLLLAPVRWPQTGRVPGLAPSTCAAAAGYSPHPPVRQKYTYL